MSKKILITGVTGQDGSYMVDYLLENTDHEIYGMVRRTAKPDLSNLKNSLGNPRFKLVTGDLSDSHSIDNLVKEIKPDYFINLAAQSFVGSSWQIPEQTFDIDATAIIRCLEAIRKHVPSCRFYNAGSSEEMGDVLYSPQDEKHPARARSPYGAAKIASRQIVKVYRESYGLYAIQGLLYNHESERRGEEFVTRKITKGVARIFHAIKSGQRFNPITLGNLESKRDWSHALDFVDGIWKMLNQPILIETDGVKHQMGTHCGTIIDNIPKEYILSSGETHSIKEFVELSFKRAQIDGYWKEEGVNCKFWLADYINASKYAGVSGPLVSVSEKFYRPAEVELLLGDSSLARKELGWSPKVSFQELVNRMTDNDILDFDKNKN